MSNTQKLFRPEAKFITEQTFSNVSEAIFDNTVLNGEYLNYVVYINQLKVATDDVRLRSTLSNDNGSSFHVSGYVTRTMSMGAAFTLSTASAEMPLCLSGGSDGIGNAADEFYCSKLILYGPTRADLFTSYECEGSYLDANAPRQCVSSTSAGNYPVTAEEHDAIRFTLSSGNMTSVTFTWYGLTQ